MPRDSHLEIDGAGRIEGVWSRHSNERHEIGDGPCQRDVQRLTCSRPMRQPAFRHERRVADPQLQVVGDHSITRVAQPGRAHETYRCAVDRRVGQAQIEICCCVRDSVEPAGCPSAKRNGSFKSHGFRLSRTAHEIGKARRVECGIGCKRARGGKCDVSLNSRAQLRRAAFQLEHVPDGVDVHPRGAHVVAFPHESGELHEALRLRRCQRALALQLDVEPRVDGEIRSVGCR